MDDLAADTSRRLMRSRSAGDGSFRQVVKDGDSNMIPSAYLVELVTETGKSPAQGHHCVAWLLDAWFYSCPSAAPGLALACFEGRRIPAG